MKNCKETSIAAVYGILSLINITLVGILLKGGKTNQVGWVWMMYTFAIVFTIAAMGLVMHAIKNNQSLGSGVLAMMLISVGVFEVVLAINHGVGNFVDFNKTSIIGMHMFEIALFGAMCAIAYGATCDNSAKKAVVRDLGTELGAARGGKYLW